MSDLSRKLISTGHKGVHDQFDCVYAAILAYQNLHIDNNMMSISLRTYHKKIIKNEIKKVMVQIGLKPGFLRVNLGLYAYELWEVIVARFWSDCEKDHLESVSQDVLLQMAGYLDNQYRTQKSADSIGFLKILSQY